MVPSSKVVPDKQSKVCTSFLQRKAYYSFQVSRVCSCSVSWDMRVLETISTIEPGDANVGFKERSSRARLYTLRAAVAFLAVRDVILLKPSRFYGLTSSIAIFSRLAGSQKNYLRVQSESHHLPGLFSRRWARKNTPVCTPGPPRLKRTVALIHGLCTTRYHVTI